MVPKKRQSKRIKASHRYKIIKRVAEHHRKQRREAKKNPQKHHKKPKDPGIPNSWPFKEELLNQIEKEKQEVEEAKQKAKEARRLAQSKESKKKNKNRNVQKE